MARALVTGVGAADGIGFAIARRLGRAGHTLALADVDPRVGDRAAELVAEGFACTGHVAELTDGAAVARLREAVGPVEVLVNNAGMGSPIVPAVQASFLEMPAEQWDRLFDISLRTAVLVTRAFAPDMVAAGRGRIVTTASVTGPMVANIGESAYGAAKAALVGFTHTLALELGPRGVTVNAVAPGWIATGASTPEELAAARATPLGRAGTPAEVAACAAFLASDEASYVNGAVLVVDGGNILQERKG